MTAQFIALFAVCAVIVAFIGCTAIIVAVLK
jgi:hypothetical protein